jgi:hypothetical protein
MLHNETPKAIKDAQYRVAEAEENLFMVVQREYPIGSRVYVRHWRGEFYGTVVGQRGRGGTEIVVKNDRSGKTTNRMPSELELVRPNVELTGGASAPSSDRRERG